MPTIRMAEQTVSGPPDIEAGGYPVFDPQLFHQFDHLQLHHPDRRRFALARHTISALCRSTRPRRVWLPRYICHSVQQAFAQEGVTLMSYGLDERLLPMQLLPEERDLVLLFNYFGLQARRSDFLSLVDTHRNGLLLLDNTHSFGMENQFPGVLSCVSPRKFLPVTDGGIAYDSAGRIKAPQMPQEVDTSWSRVGWLFRAGEEGGRQASYAEYVLARESLRQTPYLGMSTTTASLLGMINIEAWLRQRQSHYQALASQLPCHPQFRDFVHGDEFSPIGYPVLVAHAAEAQSELARHKVFAVRYWPELEAESALNAVERALLTHLLFIPISSRFSDAQIGAMQAVVHNAV